MAYTALAFWWCVSSHKHFKPAVKNEWDLDSTNISQDQWRWKQIIIKGLGIGHGTSVAEIF